MSAEESSPLEGARSFEPERPLVVKLIIVGVALVLIMAAYAYVGTRDRSLDIAAGELISQQQEDGLVCCTIVHEHEGEPYLVVVTRELEGEHRTVVVRVMEFNDDGSPREINAIGSPFPGLLPTRFSIVDDVAYVPLDGPDGAGVWSVDLSDPAWPESVGFIETGTGTTRQLAGSGDVLVVNHTEEIVILEISNRRDPQPVSRFDQHESGVMTIKLIGSTLFVNDAVIDEFRIHDLTDPGEPDLLATHINSNGPGELLIDFGTADPAARLDQIALPAKILDFDVDPDSELIYLAMSDLGLQVLDVSDLTSPEIVTEMETPDRAVRVTREGDRLHILGASVGDWEALTYSIHTVDISDPLEPELIRTINGIVSEPGIQSFTVVGDRLFVGLFESLLVFDVGD